MERFDVSPEGRRHAGDEADLLGAGPATKTSSRWAARLASFACAFACFALIPLAPFAGFDLDVPLPLVAIVLGASLAVGGAAGPLFNAGRRSTATLMVLAGWSIAAVGSMTWPHEFITLLATGGVLAGMMFSPRAGSDDPAGQMKSSWAIAGVVASLLIMPALFIVLSGARWGSIGGWRFAQFAAGAFLAVSAVAYHALTRPVAARLPLIESEIAANPEPADLAMPAGMIASAA